jgi:HAMP domain-containing protein
MKGIGMRLWLGGAFAAVSLITAATVYLLGDRPKAVLLAVALGTLAGFLIAVGISHRVARLSHAAGEMAAGSFDVPLNVGGRDEIGDLASALESMRDSLKESFGVLTADRNKLQAIFDGPPTSSSSSTRTGPCASPTAPRRACSIRTGWSRRRCSPISIARSSSGSPPTRHYGSATAPTR